VSTVKGADGRKARFERLLALPRGAHRLLIDTSIQEGDATPALPQRFFGAP